VKPDFCSVSRQLCFYIVWAESAHLVLAGYLNQIRQIADIAKRYQTIDPEGPLLHFPMSISEREWQVIENNSPDNLMDFIAATDTKSADPTE